MNPKKLFIANAPLILMLFLVFFSYRLYFWGNPTKHIYHVILNAMGDAIISYVGGYSIFKLRGRSWKRKGLLYGLSFIILGAAIAMVYYYHVMVYTLFHILGPDFVDFFNSICFQLLDSVAIIITGSFAVVIDKMNREKKHFNHRLADLNEQKLIAELNYLKSQMDPHFVFNSLNTIFYQINDEDKDAKESITQFSDILRYHMQSSSQKEVSLNEELKYIQSYIEFQSKRKTDFLKVKCRFDLEENDFQIEPLLLMPLIENAFKFVYPEGRQSGWIDIWAGLKSNRFDFSIKNSFNAEVVEKNTGAGIGLNNVIKRLNLLYQNKHHFEINNLTPSGVFTCNLTLWK